MSLGLTQPELEEIVGHLFLRNQALGKENEMLRESYARLVTDEEVGDEGVDSGDVGLEEPARPPD